MARIAGINIPVNKHIWIGLTHVYGIGRSRALAVCKAAGVAPATRVRDLTEPEVNQLRAHIEANLKKFGVGTKSKHLVHIRNPITEIDYEVAKSDGKYAREVLGFDDEPELRHSHGGHRRRVMDD